LFTVNQHKQTCGSVRMSPATLARLATTGSEAVELKQFRPSGRGSDRKETSETASVTAV